jgi:protein TonB
MLKNRHFISYFSTTILYLAMAGLFFYVQKNTLVSLKKSEEKMLNMTLSAFEPEVIPPMERVEEVMEKVEPVVEPEIIKELVVEKEIEEEVVPEPLVEKVKFKPVIKKVVKKPEVTKKTKTKKVKKKQVKKKHVTKKQVHKKPSARKSKSSQAEKDQFLANIRAKINKHKTYPRIAKKRRMQGSVNVKFTILNTGKIGNISVSGPKVFHDSAKEAVKSAFPVSTKNAPVTLPASINITLRYQIR